MIAERNVLFIVQIPPGHVAHKLTFTRRVILDSVISERAFKESFAYCGLSRLPIPVNFDTGKVSTVSLPASNC